MLQQTKHHALLAVRRTRQEMGQNVNSRLEELTTKAKQVTTQVLAACDEAVDDTKLSAAVSEAQLLEACFSGYLADLKCISQGAKEGSCCFKLHNVPQWPVARLKAWLVRNKLTVKVLLPVHTVNLLQQDTS